MSSSAQSNVGKLNLGDVELETMKGTNIRQLSPITRQMNKQAKFTLNQLDQFKLQKSIAEKLRDKVSRMMKINNEASKVEQHDNSTTMMEENTKMLKLMKNQLNNLVAPDVDKYQTLIPNNDYETVEVLPQLIPVYLKVPCNSLLSPCRFEVLMNDLDAMQVLMSTQHKFPSENKEQFEKEKLIVMDKSVLQSINNTGSTENLAKDKKKTEKKRTSILLIEASSKA